MDFDEVADELYGLPPGRFTAARGARAREARAAGERALADRIAALRRPTASAWLANRVVRERPRPTEALLQLGSDLRDAQAEPSGEEMRRLSRRRVEMVADLAREAEELARAEGRAVSAATLEELAGTFEAALADPDASAALRAGRLTGALRYSGLGFDGAGAAAGAPPSTEGRARRAGSGGVARGAARRVPAKERRAAERALTLAARDAAHAAASCDQAEGARRDVRQRIREVEALLKELRAEEATAARRVAEARRERSAAQAKERKLQRTVERLGGRASPRRLSPSGRTGS